jgi:hypothetical protein
MFLVDGKYRGSSILRFSMMHTPRVIHFWLGVRPAVRAKLAKMTAERIILYNSYISHLDLWNCLRSYKAVSELCIHESKVCTPWDDTKHISEFASNEHRISVRNVTISIYCGGDTGQFNMYLTETKKWIERLQTCVHIENTLNLVIWGSSTKFPNNFNVLCDLISMSFGVKGCHSVAIYTREIFPLEEHFYGTSVTAVPDLALSCARPTSVIAEQLLT